MNNTEQICFVAPAFNEKRHQCPIVESLLNQTDNRWKLLVYHNGPCTSDMQEWISSYNDPRIQYTESLMNTGQWGTANRADAIARLVNTPYIVNTSVQDYYIQIAVAEIMKCISAGMEFIHWQAINHLFNYSILSGEIAFGHLDWGQVCVKTELLKKVGIVKPQEFCSDWFTFQTVLPLCKKKQKINQVLTVHN